MSSKVSVIIPVFNQERYIEQAIISACEQTYQHIEVIVVNDGSTDKTDAIIKLLLPKYDTIKYIVKPNQGVSVARNLGIENSSGRYIAFLDADDYWDRSKLALFTAYMDDNPDIGLVHSNIQVVNENSDNSEVIFEGREGDLFNDLVTFNGLNIPPPSSVVIRREVLKKVSLFDPSLPPLEDQDFFIRVSRYYRIGKINKVLGFYRMHGQNAHKKAKDTARGFLRLKNKLKTYELPRRSLKKATSKIYILTAITWWHNLNLAKVLYYLFLSFVSSPSDFINYYYLKLKN